MLWEFPGGRVEEGESDQEALARELQEEMAIEVSVEEEAMHISHAYPHYDIEFRVFRCRMNSPPDAIEHIRVHDHRWVAAQDLGNYPFPDADSKTLELLLGIHH